MKKKLFSVLIILLLILFPGYIVGFLHQNVLTGLIFLNISKSITKSSDFVSNINSLNQYMYINSLPNLPYDYFPIFDKPPLNRLIDGYASCDGTAGIYLWILMFNGAKIEIIPLYEESNEISSHSILEVKYNSKKYYIDPVYKTIFLKNDNQPASLTNICNKRIKSSTKEYLDKHGYNYNLLCNYKEGFKKSPNVPKFLFKVLHLVPQFYIDRIIDQSIYIKYRNNDYIKGRLYFINNFFDKAQYHFNEIISLKNLNIYHDINTIKNHDIELYNSYIEHRDEKIKEFINDNSRYFTEKSSYFNSSYFTPYLNYYELSLFYNLLIEDNLININDSKSNLIKEHKIYNKEIFLDDSPSKYMYKNFKNYIK